MLFTPWLRSLKFPSRFNRTTITRRRHRIGRRSSAQRYFEHGPAELRLAQAAEFLEDRTLLSHIIADSSIADYEADPTITNNIKNALVSGLGEVASRLGTLSEDGDFNSTVPGVIHFDFFSTPQFSTVNLNTLLGAVDGSVLESRFNTFVTDVISSDVAAGDDITVLNTVLDKNNVMVGITDDRVTVNGSNAFLDILGGDNYELTFQLEFFLRDTDSMIADIFGIPFGNQFDLGRNID